MTPETESSCHYFYSACQNLALGNDQMNKNMFEAYSSAFAQDRVILNGQTSCISSYDFTEEELKRLVTFPCDHVTGSCRQVIKKLLKKER